MSDSKDPPTSSSLMIHSHVKYSRKYHRDIITLHVLRGVACMSNIQTARLKQADGIFEKGHLHKFDSLRNRLSNIEL